jgi:V/A-type H+-transporting ATPase subunit I
MFRPKSMKKVRLIVLKAHVQRLIKDLHEAGLVDIRKTVHKGLDEGRPLPSFDDLSAELLKLRTVLSVMEESVGRKDTAEPGIIEGAKALAEAKSLGFDEQLRRLNNDAAELGERIKALENEALTVDRVLHFKNMDFSKLRTRTLDYRVGELPQAKIAKLRERLERMGGHTALVSEPGYNVALLMFEKKGQSEVDSLLGELGFNDSELPEGMTTPIETINRINMEHESKKARLGELRKEMADLSRRNIHKVKSLLHSLEVESERAEIAERFSSSKCVHVIEGWVLEEEMDVLKSMTERYPDIIVEDVHFGHHEVPPTVLDNPRAAEPLEFVTKSYSLPNYFELDPTMAYFIGLPILYGMIVGDVLYGAASIAIGYWLMQKFKDSYTMSNVAKLWFLAGFPTLIFGLIFDEWAGMSHFHLLELFAHWTGIVLLHNPLYNGFHRLEGVFQLVVMTVAVGIVHLGFGFVLGAINEWHHNKKHALAKIAWLGVEAGMVLSLVGAIGILPSPFTIAGLVVLVLSILGLAMTEGFMGIIELPGLVGNILSYTRIAAVGVVGVVIAELLNDFLVPLPEQGIFAIILLPIFIGFHLLNAFIAMFEALVQGGRLNIVEFRSKFLHGGGEIFSPFKMR